MREEDFNEDWELRFLWISGSQCDSNFKEKLTWRQLLWLQLLRVEWWKWEECSSIVKDIVRTQMMQFVSNFTYTQHIECLDSTDDRYLMESRVRMLSQDMMTDCSISRNWDSLHLISRNQAQDPFDYLRSRLHCWDRLYSSKDLLELQEDRILPHIHCILPLLGTLLQQHSSVDPLQLKASSRNQARYRPTEGMHRFHLFVIWVWLEFQAQKWLKFLQLQKCHL